MPAGDDGKGKGKGRAMKDDVYGQGMHAQGPPNVQGTQHPGGVEMLSPGGYVQVSSPPSPCFAAHADRSKGVTCGP